MESRFNQQKANLRSFLRKRGAVIDVKRKTIKVDTEALNKKEMEKLRELERWGYEVNKCEKYTHLQGCTDFSAEEDSFLSFADEIIAMYY